MKPLLRQKINIAIDLIMFVAMVALAVIGFLIRYSLPSGEKRWERFGQNMDMTFWGLDRHEWGYIHLFLGIFLSALLVLHIVLHWTQIICMLKRLISGRVLRVMVVSGLAASCCAMVLIPILFSPDFGEPIRGHGEGHGRINTSAGQDQSLFTEGEKEAVYRDPEEKVPSQSLSPYAAEIAPSADDLPHHSEEARMLDIRGYHTLGGLAQNYHVSVEEMKISLKIPPEVSENERLGRIRRTYGFTMREVEDCILFLQKKQ